MTSIKLTPDSLEYDCRIRSTRIEFAMFVTSCLAA
jgi:hypothetical protein|tara:strand:+ start:719 stop:823 length:105 start_codon:yes stop_codon:yes gene_type:complete